MIALVLLSIWMSGVWGWFSGVLNRPVFGIGYIFEFKFLEDTYDQWEREFKGNQQKIETMCNWSYIYDIFHLNSPDVSDKELASLAKVLSFTWSLTFERLYPDRNYTVDAFLDMEDWVITAYRD